MSAFDAADELFALAAKVRNPPNFAIQHCTKDERIWSAANIVRKQNTFVSLQNGDIDAHRNTPLYTRNFQLKPPVSYFTT
jgi:hypothetical protein